MKFWIVFRKNLFPLPEHVRAESFREKSLDFLPVVRYPVKAAEQWAEVSELADEQD